MGMDGDGRGWMGMDGDGWGWTGMDRDGRDGWGWMGVENAVARGGERFCSAHTAIGQIGLGVSHGTSCTHIIVPPLPTLESII